jgi:hypothetical protein
MLVTNHKFKTKIKGIIDYSTYMVEKRITHINREVQLMKNEFLENLAKSK